MNLEQLIVQFFFTNKKLSLQDIGTFTLLVDEDAVIEYNKETVGSHPVIKFDYNGKTLPDNSLIDYIVQQTKKIKPLASADLESYTILGSQFLNLGKVFFINGLGSLHKSQVGGIEFIQGNLVNPSQQDKNQGASKDQVQNTVSAPYKEKSQNISKEKTEEEISFSAPKVPLRSKNNVLMVSLLIFLGLAAMAIFYFFNKDNNEEGPAINTSDTVVTASPIIPDSLKTIKPESRDYTFKIVIKEYPTRAAAQKNFGRLTSYGHKLDLYSTDSLKFKLAMPFNRPLSDTAKAKDSLRILFGGKTYVDTN